VDWVVLTAAISRLAIVALPTIRTAANNLISDTVVDIYLQATHRD